MALNKIRNGKSINALAQVAASAALEDIDYLQKLEGYLRMILSQRADIQRLLDVFSGIAGSLLKGEQKAASV